MDIFTLFVIVGSMVATATLYTVLCSVLPSVIAGFIVSALTIIVVAAYYPSV